MSSSRAVARSSGAAAATSTKPRSSNKDASPVQAVIQLQQLTQNPQHFNNNIGIAYYLRIYMTIVAGAAVGILGVEGWGGFTAYLISQLLCTLPILAKCGGNYPKYLATWDKVFLEHIFSSTAILSYILFWMIFYNICHVF